MKGISLGFDSIEAGLVIRGFTIQEGNSDVVYARAEVQTTVNKREFNRVRGRVYKTSKGGILAAYLVRRQPCQIFTYRSHRFQCPL